MLHINYQQGDTEMTKIEAGKTYTLDNGTVIKVTYIGTRNFDRAWLADYTVIESPMFPSHVGKSGSTPPNQLVHMIVG